MKTILFVCTGDICRSPMAEGLFRHAVKGRNDFRVISAGVGAVDGLPPSEHAVRELKELGIDISKQRSHMLTSDLIQQADYIFGMTYSHVDAITMLYPHAAEKTFLLREFDETLDSYENDISDPIGGSYEVYLACRDQIEQGIAAMLKFIDQTSGFQTERPSSLVKTKIALGADHEGFELKETLKLYLQKQGHTISDFGAYSREASDYAQYARSVSNGVAEHEHDFGILVCASGVVMEAQGSVLTNKYAEGYPKKRWYGGCENVDTVEQLAIERAVKLFNAEHANVQPHSGSSANMAVYFSMLKPGDKMLTMDLSHGGHLTHGNKANFSGKFFEIIHYGVRKSDEQIDYDQLAEMARTHKPRMITVGASAYPRVIDFARMGEIARELGAYLLADIAHIAGLVATGLHPSPVEHADFVTTTTHKTLRGPRGGLVLCKEKYAKEIDSQTFPGIQGGPLMQVIAAKAVCFHEALQPGFKAYQQQIVKNARALAEGMKRNGYRLVSGGTDYKLM